MAMEHNNLCPRVARNRSGRQQRARQSSSDHHRDQRQREHYLRVVTLSSISATRALSTTAPSMYHLVHAHRRQRRDRRPRAVGMEGFQRCRALARVDRIGDVTGRPGWHRFGCRKAVFDQTAGYVEADRGRSPTSTSACHGRGCSAHPGRSRAPATDVIAQPDGGTLVRQQLEQRGVVGALVGRMMLKKTKRFLELEAQGLKARSEQLHRPNDQLS